MGLSGFAKETLKIIEDGCYTSKGGHEVVVREQIDSSIKRTRLYRPADFDDSRVFSYGLPEHGNSTRIDVTAESTAEAARRLVSAEGLSHVVLLNFASAKNPGGGFLGGAKAQEEDLARCSALYPCLLAQPVYYEVNRAHDSLLYTDHMIYAPDVTFFRDDSLKLLESPFLVSVITAPAPNAGEVLRRDRGQQPQISETLRRRAARVLEVCAANEHRVLILGAWGCGVFRNDPAEVSDVFGVLLASDRFRNAFAQVVFAIYDRSPKQGTLHAFEKRFAGI